MKTRGLYGLFTSCMLASVLAAHARPTVQVAWEGSPAKQLVDNAGRALTPGLAGDGDGALLELGYFDAGTALAPFAGSFVALTGEGSADPALRTTSIGDAGGGTTGGGTFSLSTNFKSGSTVFQGTPPAVGTPLVIRIFDAKTKAASTNYNVVTGGANWLWKAPTEGPGTFVLLSLADTGLNWQGGANSSFKTAMTVIPSMKAPPSESGSDSDHIPAVVGGALTLSVPARTDGATYRVAGLPAGLRLNTSTGQISGVPTTPGNYRIVVTPVTKAGISDTPTEFEVTVGAIANGLVGRFSGLVARSSALNRNLGAALQLTTTSTGAYSGRLLVGAVTYNFKGRLALDGAAPTLAAISLPLPQLGANVQLNLTLDGAAQTFSGTLANGAATAAISGSQNPWSRQLPATSLRGAYAFQFQQAEIADGSPAGYSFGTLQVNPANGAVVIAATLADGTRVNSGAVLGKGGEVIVYAPFKGGSLTGELDLSAGSSAPTNNTLSGALTWLRVAGAGNVYASGFGPLTLDAAGGASASPAKGSLVMGLAAPVEGALENAVLRFTGGGLDTEDLEFSRGLSVSVPASANGKNVAVVSAGSPVVTLPTLNAATGAFAGTFIIPGRTADLDRTVRFEGQIVTVAGATRGYGAFLLPTLPEEGQTLAKTARLSGSVIFEKPEASAP